MLALKLIPSPRSTAPSHNPFVVPHLLSLFFQTLTLIISTVGPHSFYLASITHETLDLLLSFNSTPVANEPIIMSALLSLFLAVVDLNVASGSAGEERLVTDLATQVMELREWLSDVFDSMPATKGRPQEAANDPQEQARTLAAGIMVKLSEVIERYQGRLMGVNVGFNY